MKNIHFCPAYTVLSTRAAVSDQYGEFAHELTTAVRDH
jgi:hypothetical protein